MGFFGGLEEVGNLYIVSTQKLGYSQDHERKKDDAEALRLVV